MFLLLHWILSFLWTTKVPLKRKVPVLRYDGDLCQQTEEIYVEAQSRVQDAKSRLWSTCSGEPMDS